MTIEQLKETAAFLEELESALVNHGVSVASLRIEVAGVFYDVQQVSDNGLDLEDGWHLELVETR